MTMFFLDPFSNLAKNLPRESFAGACGGGVAVRVLSGGTLVCVVRVVSRPVDGGGGAGAFMYIQIMSTSPISTKPMIVFRSIKSFSVTDGGNDYGTGSNPPG